MILKVISANSEDPDQVHIVCLYAKIGLKSLQEYQQMTFSDASFLGVLRVNLELHAIAPDKALFFFLTKKYYFFFFFLHKTHSMGTR